MGLDDFLSEDKHPESSGPTHPSIPETVLDPDVCSTCGAKLEDREGMAGAKCSGDCEVITVYRGRPEKRRKFAQEQYA